MPAFLGVPVAAAYHVVSVLATILAPVLSGLAAAGAIVLFTMGIRLLLLPLSYRAMRGMDAQARLAPQVQALQKKHAGQPDRLQRELAALYRSEGTSMLAGCLPLLAQWPFLSVMYLLFRSPVIGGKPNSLLAHDLFSAPLGSHWLGGAGPLSAQGAVFAGLFVLLAVIGWFSARLAPRLATPATSLTAAPTGTTTAAATGTASGTRAVAAPAAPASPADQAARTSAALARLAPFITVVFAAFVPLAAGLYLLTTTAWTLAERTFLRRRMSSLAGSRGAAGGRSPRAGA
jgi:YidC/Oxa1 family membrane protein insertase